MKFGPVFELSSLDGLNGFQISGEARGDLSGFSVASAGDVNGDGFADVIVGAIGVDQDRSGYGASYVVFGKAGGFGANLDLSTLDGVNGFKIDGETRHSYSGRSVASAGDVNGDGFDDVIIGAGRVFGAGRTDSNASYVVFGKAGGFDAEIDLASLDGANGFRIIGEAEDDFSGRSVASAGDVNGDGFDDVIVGAPLAGPSINRPGTSYVVFGQADGFGADLNLATLDGTNGFRIEGDRYSDESGSSVASAGDVNGDGFDDVIVGARYAYPNGAGASYVIFGKAGGFQADLNLSNLDGTNGFRINGEAGDLSGFSVASAGDVNGDGFDDLIVGAPFADPHGSRSGASYVVFGHAGGFAADLDLSSLDGSNGFRISGEAAGDFSGASVASAGDINGDGFDDLIVGARYASPNGSGSGASYVIFGHASGPVTRVGTAADEFFVGGAFRDSLEGRGGDDVLLGNGGNDHRLLGGGGNDMIDGGAGRDFLTGGEGQDTLTGGADGDRFVFTGIADSPADSGPDVITDFEPGLDRISLKPIDADPGLVGDQAFVFLGMSGFTGAGGEVRYRQTVDATIVAGDVDGDGAADFQVRLAGLIDLTAGDFIL